MNPAAASPPADLEVEWQFDAPDLDAVERWLWAPPAALAARVVPRGERRLEDTYVDTADRIVGRARFTLRLRRRAGSRIEVTLKSVEEVRDREAPRVRTELSAVADAGFADTARIQGRCGEVLRALVGTKSLAPLFEVRTARRVFDVTLAGAAVEVALDRTLVRAGEREASITRVEIEMLSGSQDVASAFVGVLGEAVALQPSSRSKFGTGALLAGLPAPETVVDELVPGPRTFDRRATAQEAGRAMLRGQLVALRSQEPIARLGIDPEGVHQMRVATRRMRAGIRLFADALPPAWSEARHELRWLAGALGAVRDLDVQLEAIEAWAREAGEARETEDAPEEYQARLEVVRHLAARRAEARVALLEALDSPRFEALVRTLTALLRPRPRRPALRIRIKARVPTGAENEVERLASQLGAMLGAVDGPRARLRIGRFGRGKIVRAHRRYRKVARALRPGSPPADYHRVRIEAKGLRYAVEFLAPVTGRPGRRFIQATKTLQDRLGAHQDACVAEEQLRALATGAPALSPRAVFAMGELAAARRDQAGRLRRGVPRDLTRLDRRWPKLRRRLRRVAR